ncbi:hypothetical protein FACS1894126_5730 [Alphaproteobacteria bacterium]|nr:hypothetical protein FACS1894126_5730 [Alphaproteobacteria bacterium]
MGQIFHACAYDIESKTCCVMDADKFHANCYSFSGAVCSIHYLLRQKPYRIMWGGGHVVIRDNLEMFDRKEELLGISTYENLYSFEINNEDLESKNYYDKIKFIEENSKLWNKISVWNEAKKYFDLKNTKSVKYSGFLVNHTKRQAIDLADYYVQSVSLTSEDDDEYVIDVIPALTETGEGLEMALFNGLSTDTTEQQRGTWRADLLQIVDELPSEYEVVTYCFAEVWGRARYCRKD